MYPLPFFLFFIPSLSSYFYSSSSILLFLPIPSCSSFFLSWILLYFTFFSLLLVFHLLLLYLFFHLSLYPIPSFSFSSTYSFSSLIHPASIYFLSLASQYTPLLFSHPSSSIPLFFLLYSLLSIFSVPQSPLLLPTHSFPFFFFQCAAFSSLSFSSYFYFSFPLHSFMILLFILLQFSFPPLPIIILSLKQPLGMTSIFVFSLVMK